MERISITKKRLVLAISALAILFAIIFIWFNFDLGINAKHHIRSDFNTAFTARQTGNCEEFSKWVSPIYWSQWRTRCFDEKDSGNKNIPITSFKIQQITISGDKAFLLVELQRSNSFTEKVEPYSVNYELKRFRNGIYSRWLLNQPVTK